MNDSGSYESARDVFQLLGVTETATTGPASLGGSGVHSALPGYVDKTALLAKAPVIASGTADLFHRPGKPKPSADREH